jgi:hypothetical protein
LDRNRLRRATLVRGFRVSRAVRSRAVVGLRAPAAVRHGALGPLVTARHGYGPPPCRRHATATTPPRRLPAGRTVLRGSSGAAFGWATRLQPDVARVATAARQSTHPSVQQPHGDGRSRGTDRVGVRPRGADFHEGGHRGGTTGAAKRCAGPDRPSTEKSGGTDGPDRRTFRSLKLLVLRAPHRTRHACRRSRSTPRHDASTPPFPLRGADLAGLAWPTSAPVGGSVLSIVTR